MKVIDSPISDNIWLQLDNEFSKSVIPEGFESITQLSAKLKRGLTSTKSLMYKLVEADKVDVIKIGNFSTKYYRPKNYAKQNKR